ncbi:MAG: epoxyqueuosine reductase [Chloroflexi bacterium]|nr:epoxyqueuosine reductase [Chloroflexota bacterium]
MTDLQAFLVDAIKTFVAESPANRLRDIDGSPIFEEPLVGFADGDDPLFELYKTVAGERHMTPREVLAAQSPTSAGGEPPELSRVGVVSWILPIAKETRLSNRKMADGPSLRWNHTRFQGEEFNGALCRHVVSLFEEKGYVAVPPMFAPTFKSFRSATAGWTSTWSERHAAYAAGLGTFSLTDGLITARGIAHRCGSVVANAAFIPSSRPYSHHLANCPYPEDGTCGACIKRCPGGAIGATGHDKEKCYQTLAKTLRPFLERPGYIGYYAACGLCQTKVPCESRIPRRATPKRVSTASVVE